MSKFSNFARKFLKIFGGKGKSSVKEEPLPKEDIKLFDVLSEASPFNETYPEESSAEPLPDAPITSEGRTPPVTNDDFSTDTPSDDEPSLVKDSTVANQDNDELVWSEDIIDDRDDDAPHLKEDIIPEESVEIAKNDGIEENKDVPMLKGEETKPKKKKSFFKVKNPLNKIKTFFPKKNSIEKIADKDTPHLNDPFAGTKTQQETVNTDDPLDSKNHFEHTSPDPITKSKASESVSDLTDRAFIDQIYRKNDSDHSPKSKEEVKNADVDHSPDDIRPVDDEGSEKSVDGLGKKKNSPLSFMKTAIKKASSLIPKKNNEKESLEDDPPLHLIDPLVVQEHEGDKLESERDLEEFKEDLTSDGAMINDDPLTDDAPPEITEESEPSLSHQPGFHSDKDHDLPAETNEEPKNVINEKDVPKEEPPIEIESELPEKSALGVDDIFVNSEAVGGEEITKADTEQEEIAVEEIKHPENDLPSQQQSGDIPLEIERTDAASEAPAEKQNIDQKVPEEPLPEETLPSQQEDETLSEDGFVATEPLQSSDQTEESPLTNVDAQVEEESETPVKDDPDSIIEEETVSLTLQEKKALEEKKKKEVSKEKKIKEPLPDEEKSAFSLDCIQYLSFGKYFFVFARKKPPHMLKKKTDIEIHKKTPLKEFQDGVAAEKKAANRVFVITGSKKEMNDACLETLSKLGCEPILAHDQFDFSESTDRRYIQYPDVKFAIIILSGDDFVYPKNGKPADAWMRTRQDIVFELGNLVGKLGRQNVFSLYYEQKSFLLPTSLHNAAYTPYDNGGHWKNELAQRLQLAGLNINKDIRF